MSQWYAKFLMGLILSDLVSCTSYKKQNLSPSSWSPHMEKKVPFAVLSLVECSALCRTEGCDLFVKDGSDCYLGDAAQTFPLMPAFSNEATLFLTTSFSQSQVLAQFVKVSNLNDSVLFETSIYLSEPAPSTLQCGLNCLQMETNCRVFVFADNTCHYGGLTPVDNPDLQLPATWDAYVAHNHLQQLANNDFEELLDNVTADSWSAYVYSSVPVSNDQECVAQCYYQQNYPCHYLVVDEDVCFLGNFHEERHLLDPLPTNENSVFVFKGNIFEAGYHNWTIRLIWSQMCERFLIFHATIPSLDVCIGLCHIQFYHDCHFYIHTAQDDCYLGSFNQFNDGQLYLNGTDLQPALVREKLIRDTVAETLFTPITLSGLVWYVYIFDDNTAYSVDECAAVCALSSDPEWCDFFVVDGLQCKLGSKKAIGNHSMVTHETMIHVSKVALEMSDFEETVMPGTEWSRHIYKTVELTVSGEEALEQCHAYCFLDGGPCHLFALIDPTCYLGDWNVDTDLVDLATSATVHSRIPMAALSFGGQWSKRMDNAFLENKNYCVDHGIPGSANNLRQMSMAYREPWLMRCGGMSMGSPEVSKHDCRRMNMSEPVRYWTSMALMPFPRTSYPWLTVDGRHIFAFTGLTANSSVTDAVDMYDADFDAWTAMVTLHPAGRLRDVCGVALQLHGQFWLLGGRRADPTETYTGVWTMNPTLLPSNAWEEKPPIPDGFVAQMFCEAFVDHGTARTWIMAAGGLNDAGESATHLRYIDVEQGAMWRYLPPLPKKVGYPLTSASLFKFSEATELVLMPGTVEGETMNNPDVMFSYNILTRRFDEVRSRISHAHSKLDGAGCMIPLHKLWTCIPQSAEWVILVGHNSFGEDYFTYNVWESEPDNIESNVYMNLNLLPSFVSCTGKYHFRLVYPELGYFNEWWQTSDPTLNTDVNGYQPIAVALDTHFGGLRLYDGSDDLTSLTGDERPGHFWYGVGVTKAYNPAAPWDLPGPPDVPKVTRMRLFIKKDC